MENTKKHILSVSLQMTLLVDEDILSTLPAEALESLVLNMVQTPEGVAKMRVDNLQVHSFGEAGFICPVCGGELAVETSMSGLVVGEVDFASGAVSNHEFEGTKHIEVKCKEDPSHALGDIAETLKAVLSGE